MRAELAVKYNAALGAVLGLAAADALSALDAIPSPVCEGSFVPPAFGAGAGASFELGEQLLNGQPIAIDVGPQQMVAPAIALAEPASPPLLLADPDAAMMCSLIERAMCGTDWLADACAECEPDSQLAACLSAVAAADDFAQAMARVETASRALAGALAGLRWGPAGIPAAWTTHLSGPVGQRTYRLRQLRRLVERLMGQEQPSPPEPRRSLGPRQVAPQLWLSNLHAVPFFVREHPDAAVISLCPTTGAIDAHIARREFALIDAPGRLVNPRLSDVVDEVLDTIEQFHHEGRDVLVHCHHGASRTGLVLRAWLIAELNLSSEDATTEAQVRWPKTSTWNNAFNNELKRRAGET